MRVREGDLVDYDGQIMCFRCAEARGVYEIIYDTMEGRDNLLTKEDLRHIVDGIIKIIPGHPMLAPYLNLLYFFDNKCNGTKKIKKEEIESAIWRNVKTSLRDVLNLFEEAGLIRLTEEYDGETGTYTVWVECTQDLLTDLREEGRKSIGKLFAAVYRLHKFDVRDFTVIINSLMRIIGDDGKILPAYRIIEGYRCRLCGDFQKERDDLIEHLRSKHNIENPIAFFESSAEPVEVAIIPISDINREAKKLKRQIKSNIRFITEKLKMGGILKPKNKRNACFLMDGNIYCYVSESWIKLAYRLREKLRERKRFR